MSDAALAWAAAHKADLPTPCYLYDEAQLAASAASLSALVPGAQLLFSLKANPQPGLVTALHRCGVGAEIGSEAEYDAARAAGVEAAKIVVGGVSRSREFVAHVCRDRAGAYIIEAADDLDALPDGADLPLLVRIRPALEGAGASADPAGWFGLEMPEAIDVIRTMQQRGLRWDGVHFHAGSQKLDSRRVAESVDRLTSGLAALREAGLRPRIVDFGPGIGVPYRADDKPLDEDALPPVFARLRDAMGDAALWVEAGRRLVAAAGTYVTRIVSLKMVGGKLHAFTDGGIHVHNPGIGLGRMLHANPRFHFPGSDAPPADSKLQLVGSLCTPADLLGRDVAAPPLKEGDLVAVENAGAYCATTGMWGFNSRGLFSEIMLGRDGTAVTLEPQHARLQPATAAPARS